ncbi:MAG: hypothetical protein GTO29_13410 [Candidatus Latescibacteria bacterium]|nr:hypothetical protein [Candidatus Latescibacterota bacterium]NIO57249.1 hypothetical protein [Candidatus Latescibacterota bacterium]
MNNRIVWICILVLASPIVFGCATGRSVYVDPSTVDEKGAQFGDTDIKLMSEEIVSELLQAPFIERVEKPATISIIGIENKTSEFINTDDISDKIMIALINSGSGVFEFVDREMLEETMAEFELGASGIVSTEEATRLGRAAGVNFLMTGSLSSITKVDRREDQRFYRLSMRLVDVERNTVTWVHEKEIRKIARKGVLKW